MSPEGTIGTGELKIFDLKSVFVSFFIESKKVDQEQVSHTGVDQRVPITHIY